MGKHKNLSVANAVYYVARKTELLGRQQEVEQVAINCLTDHITQEKQALIGRIRSKLPEKVVDLDPQEGATYSWDTALEKIHAILTEEGEKNG